MIKFFIHEFTMRWSRIEKAAALFMSAAAGAKGSELLTPEDFQYLLPVTNDLLFVCEALELKFALKETEQLKNTLESKPCSFQTVDALLENIVHSINKEADERMLAFIPTIKREFFEQDALFGEAVNKTFPSARSDIKAAGNCLSADLNTAAMFHLMRAAEYGLKALARHLKVRTVKKRVPLEFGTWGEIFSAMNGKINILSGTTRGKKRQAALEFYNGVMLEVKALKDVWRDSVMHSRGEYDERQALNALNHVRGFMQRLATRVSE